MGRSVTSPKQIVTKTNSATKTTSKTKTAAIAGAIGLAVAGGAGGTAIYLSNSCGIDTGPIQTATAEPDYKVTERELRCATQKLSNLEVRKTETTRQFNDNGFVPSGWVDADGNKCPTRYDILANALYQSSKDDATCTINSGYLYDPYSKVTINYSKDSSQIHIDHIVAKKNAWGSGGYAWDEEKWTDYVNAPMVLLAVSSTENQSKGSKDAADWLVPKNPDFQCRYVIYQINVKTFYKLTVRQVEKDAMTNALATCQVE